jgi:hypothetical protein
VERGIFVIPNEAEVSYVFIPPFLKSDGGPGSPRHCGGNCNSQSRNLSWTSHHQRLARAQ